MYLKRRSLQLFPLATLLLLLGSAEQVRAGQILYASSLEGQRIVRVDTGTNQVTTIVSASVQVDSLAFTPQGNIAYTGFNDGSVWLYNVTTNTNTRLASGLGHVQDLVLDPSGTSVLVSAGPTVDTLGNLVRVNLTGGATTIASYTSTQGLAYDSSGNLYGNINGRVDRLNPTTGAILQMGTQSNLDHLDGLTYDSYTGMLYASAQFNNVIYAINPTTLSATVLTSNAPGPDGIEGDGMGNLYFASRSTSDIYRYNLTTNTQTQLTNVSGLDDLAPVFGNGAPPAPEPGTLVLAGTGLLGLFGYRLARRKRSA